eukprot:TRINITY_DN551_c0_g1_i19.p3 TRINITY_DN551_c0_g1~~TRINITY_DN551_c0_g1_i19.p3  ORF type:complete len:176 (+),score=37.10 TRINITY_DN551_c0_g1_i19:28-528(+)
MALELGPYGIRVNSVNPTVVMTAMGIAAWGDSKLSDQMKEKIPLGRFVEPSEVADTVLYLLSEKASMLNGVILPKQWYQRRVRESKTVETCCGGFQGKKVLVTGAGQGLGREICLQLAMVGAHVVGLSRTECHLASLKESVETISGNNLFHSHRLTQTQVMAGLHQ